MKHFLYFEFLRIAGRNTSSAKISAGILPGLG
jgi:hypothetical protein